MQQQAEQNNLKKWLKNTSVQILMMKNDKAKAPPCLQGIGAYTLEQDLETIGVLAPSIWKGGNYGKV